MYMDAIPCVELSVVQELIHERNKLELQRNKLREALQKISMLSQTTCLSFEAQSFKATSIACFALADIKKEAAK